MSHSYWSEAIQLNTTQTTKLNYDFIIVGAGIAGVSAAYWLEKKHPQAQIAVIDKHTLGYGATGRNAGFVTCGSVLHFHRLNEKFGLPTAKNIWNFSEQNHQLLADEIIQDQASTVDYKKTGACTVIPTGSNTEKFNSILTTMKNVGISVEMLSPHQLQKDYAVKESQGGIEYQHDGVIHPLKLLQKIANKLKNTNFIFDEEVTQIQGGRVAQVLTSQKAYSASKVYVCMNGYIGNLLSEFKNWIKPQRGQIILTEPQDPLIKGPCYLTQHLCYFRQLSTGEILIGGFRNHDSANENTTEDQVTYKIQNALENFAKTYFNHTQNIKINYRWSGIMGFTPDEQMMIGEHPQKQNVHIMAGCSGHGMGLSFHAAKVMINNSVPDFFKIDRFKL